MAWGTFNGSLAVGVGLALILVLPLIVGDLLGGILGAFACALIAGVACGALVGEGNTESATKQCLQSDKLPPRTSNIWRF